jgi:hypothetical protein
MDAIGAVSGAPRLEDFAPHAFGRGSPGVGGQRSGSGRDAEQRVARTEVGAHVVSTVWLLGVDHGGLQGGGPSRLRRHCLTDRNSGEKAASLLGPYSDDRVVADESQSSW